MIDTFKSKQLYLFVVLQNRFNPTLKKLKQAILQNRFGKIYFSHINVFWNRSQDYYDMDEWRGTKSLDGGSLMNQASHYVDLLYWLFGDINELNCFSGTLGRKIECEDTSSINFRFKNGVMASLNVTTLTYNQNFEGSITIIGEKGTVKISGKAVNEIQHWEFEDKEIEDDKIFETNYNIKNIYGNGHINYYENVISTLRGINKPEIDGEEGLKSLEIIDMSYRSHETNTNVKKKN
ncbi:Gfo/Idh/MocA family oxidoreductase [Pelagibacteraceae bacterium]|nr:Gfo/Idh/MocA family oxidoreductase [Pelagibacteraceae bacterium]